ncbi:MAG: flagellar protein FlaG [Desulfohalobiaceae bacterium]
MYPEKIAGSVQQMMPQQKTEQKQGQQQAGSEVQRNQGSQEELNRLNQDRMAAEQEKDDKDKEKSDSLLSEDLDQIQEATNELLAQMNIQLDFEINNELEKVIVKVRNRESGEVIRQIPPEEILRMAQRMQEMSGMLLDKWS